MRENRETMRVKRRDEMMSESTEEEKEKGISPHARRCNPFSAYKISTCRNSLPETWARNAIDEERHGDCAGDR